MRSFFCKPAWPAVLIVVAMLQALSGCRGSSPQSQANSVSPKPASAAEPQLAVTSVAFKAGTAIPRQYTCDGINISPPIEWSGPSGTHRYFFKIYALDAELLLKAGATRDELEKAMAGHIVAQGQLMGTYRR